MSASQVDGFSHHNGFPPPPPTLACALAIKQQWKLLSFLALVFPLVDYYI